MRNYFIGFIAMLFLSSCGINMGTRIDNENLSVFFLEGVNKEKAIAFTEYWKNHGFVGERKQVIQLEKENNVILIKLIERKEYQNDDLTITEESMIQQLERDLTRNIFEQETRIVITDNTFRPILKR